MKTSLLKKIVSAILVVTLTINMWAVAAFANVEKQENISSSKNLNEISDAQLNSLFNEALFTDQNDKKVLSKEELSSFVDYETASKQGHIERLSNRESLNTIVYLNKNNTKTVYYFEDSIKYVNENGEIIEKDISLIKTSAGYSTKKNDISVLFSDEISKGIDIGYKGSTIKLIPVTDNKASNKSVVSVLSDEERNAVKYSSVFNEKTDISYIPTLNGFKEEIVLSEYTGINTWKYLVYTDGMFAFCGEDGIYYFAKSKDAEEKFSLGQVFIYDSEDHFDGGSMNVTEIESGKTYMITITVDAAFLENKETVYPVYVDPQVEITNANTTSNIIDTTVYSVKNTTNTGTWVLNHAGYYNSSYGVGRILVKLPGLTNSTEYLHASADDIANVTFYICEATGRGGQSLEIHAFTGANWTETGATWNNVNANSYSSNVISTATPESRAFGAFDITSLVKAWKNGTNSPDCGFIIKNTNETAGAQCRAFIGNNNATVSQRPKLSVTYCNSPSATVSGNKGINDLYTYDTTFLDKNVSTYVSNAYGNLVSVKSLNVKAKEFPIPVEYVYNSTLYFDSSSYGDFYNYYGISTNYKMGKGWKLSLIELVKYDSSEDTYKYTDVYGTEYLFEKDGTDPTYSNSVINAKLSVDTGNNSATIEYDNIKRNFNSNGLVSSVEYNDKTYTYNYTGTYALSSVTCSGETVLTVSYTSSKLTGIADYTFSYNSSLNLTGISNSYDDVILYQTSNQSFAVRNEINLYSYLYTYNASSKVKSIKYCRYKNSTYNVINEKSIGYSNRYTVYCEPGIDNDLDTLEDNIYTTVVFGEDKRTIYSVIREKDGNRVYDANMNPLSERETNNKTSSSVAGGGKENFIDNSSFEKTTGVTGLTRSTEEKLSGEYSAKLSSSGTVNFNAYLAPGEYTFSAYVKLKNVSLSSQYTSGGALLEVRSASNTLVSQSECYVGTSMDSIGKGWYRIFVSFNVSTAQTYKLCIVLRNATGTLYADCAQLEFGNAPSEYNAVSFGGAESASGTNPWSSSSFIVSSDSQATDREHSWQLSAGKTVYCDIPVNAPYYSHFVLAGWSKTASIVSTEYGIDVTLIYSDNTTETIPVRFDGAFPGWQYQCFDLNSTHNEDDGLMITNVRVSLVNHTDVPAYYDDVFLSMAEYYDEAGSSESEDTNNYSEGLTFISNGDGTCSITGRGTCTDTVIIIPEEYEQDTVVSVGNNAFKNQTDIVEVVLPNTLTGISDDAFSGCTSLTKIGIPESVTSIGYKAFANCTSLKTLNIQKSVTSFGGYAFSGTTGLTLYYEGTSADYSAITKGTGAVPSGVTVVCNANIIGDIAYIYTYDSNQNVTSTTMKYVGADSASSNTTEVIYTSSTYDANGNCLSYTDEAGNTTVCTYDSHGNVLSITDASNVTTTYTYNSDGFVTAMSRGTATNTYTYTNGLLTRIVHSDTSTNKSETYNIAYNVFGNITSIAVGTVTIISYEYSNGGAGDLTKTTYGNGDYETYSYDVWGNLIKQYFGTTLKYEYDYDVNGNVVVSIDYESGRTKKQIYGANKEYVGTAIINNATNNVIALSEGETYKLDGNTFDFSSEYDYLYDTLDRTSSITLKNGNVNIITKTFTYVNGTNLIENEEFSNNSTNNNGIDYSYVYDSLNRLTEVRENGTIKSRYTYDDMGKLIREDNAYANKSYVYEYTANGNISAKKTYAYTTGTLGTVQKTESRTYGNTDWTDQLTKINGTTITYDGMGNPLNWRNASSLDWDGRRLKSFTKTDGTVITYTYDENGLRTSKTVGTDRIDYVYDGSRLIEEKHAGYTLKFLYDESSTLIGFNYSTSSFSGNFYYGIDNFGNIKYIYDSNGEIITTYRYDAWGRLISSSGYQSERFGKWNPFRYKSYYYDAETELYYLQSRYYDASVGRFVNADEPMLLGTSGGVYAYNLYAYCENDPVNSRDVLGCLPVSLKNIVGKNWLMELVYSFLPNVYRDKTVKTVTLINLYVLKVELVFTIFSWQTNSSGLFGIALGLDHPELSAFIPIYGDFCMAISGGFSWREVYFSLAILCASPYSGGIYCGFGIKVTASTWAAIAVTAACLAVPGLNAVYAKCVAVLSSKSILVPALASILGLVPKVASFFS